MKMVAALDRAIGCCYDQQAEPAYTGATMPAFSHILSTQPSCCCSSLKQDTHDSAKSSAVLVLHVCLHAEVGAVSWLLPFHPMMMFTSLKALMPWHMHPENTDAVDLAANTGYCSHKCHGLCIRRCQRPTHMCECRMRAPCHHGTSYCAALRCHTTQLMFDSIRGARSSVTPE